MVMLHTEECKEAHERKLAEKSDPKNVNVELNWKGQKWRLGCRGAIIFSEGWFMDAGYVNYGDPVRYATEEDS